MANTPLDIVIIEDDSVLKKINKAAQSLQNKYTKKRKVNEKVLKPKTPTQKVFSAIFDVLCVVLIFISAIICISTINAKIQKTVPSIFEYSNLTISSGSMVASGFNIGDVAVIRQVDTDTLKSGDIIAFYCYGEVNGTFDINSCERVDESTIGDKKWTFSFASLLGVETNEIKAAAQKKSSIVFHEIQEVYTDNSGHRWFVTKGSSNTNNDVNIFGYIQDSMVIGSYTNSGISGFWSGVLKGTSSFQGVFIILIPVILLGLSTMFEGFKETQKAKLELDCVEEKRKITDPICVKNNIGFGMDKKTKYKILAQATDEQRLEYLSLLWKDGSAPDSVRKYVHKKNILLKGNRKLLDLNRECEKMFADGVTPSKIATHYMKEKTRIENEQTASENRLKSLRRAYNKGNDSTQDK